LSKHFCP